MRKMWRRAGIVFIMLLVCFNPTLPKSQAEDGNCRHHEPIVPLARPDAEEIPVQTLIIGSYLIHLNALSNDNVQAALLTIDETRQGMYYKSEFGDEQWFKIDNAMTQIDITSYKQFNIVNSLHINRLFLAVWIDEEGNLHNLLELNEVCDQIERLEQKQETLEGQIEAAYGLGDNNRVTTVSMEKKSVESALGFWRSMLKGDAKEAASHLAVINNPDNILAELEQDALALFEQEKGRIEEELQDALARGAEALADELQTQLDQMNDVVADLPLDAFVDSDMAAEQAEQMRQEAVNTIDDNTVGESVSQVLDAVDAVVLAKMNQSGLAEEIAGLLRSLDALAVARSEIELQLMEEDAAPMLVEQLQNRLEEIETVTHLLDSQLAGARIEELFLFNDTLLDMIEQIQESAALSAPDVTALLMEDYDDRIEEIKAITRTYYSDEEREAAEQWEVPVQDGKALPLESVISNARHFKIDIPPFVESSVPFIQVRPVSERFGVTVIWDDQMMTSTFVDRGTMIVLQVGSHVAYVNGQAVHVDYEPRLLEGYMVVPVDFLSEMLQLDVNWDEVTETIQIRI